MLKRLMGVALAAALLSGCGNSPRPQLPANVIPAAAVAIEATAASVVTVITSQLDAGGVSAERASRYRLRLIAARSFMLGARATYDAVRGPASAELVAARAITDEQIAGLLTRLDTMQEVR